MSEKRDLVLVSCALVLVSSVLLLASCLAYIGR